MRGQIKMNFNQFLLSTIFFFLFFGAFDSKAQQSREMQPLDVQDFECMQSLDCVQSSQSLNNKGWLFVFDETVDEFASELRARMKGENVSLFAVYDTKGLLIRSTYKRKNIALPSCLLAYLTQDKYKNWQITGTEMEMKDFDINLVQFKVMLEDKSSVLSEVYDYDFINGLHVEYEDLGKRCKL